MNKEALVRTLLGGVG